MKPVQQSADWTAKPFLCDFTLSVISAGEMGVPGLRGPQGYQGPQGDPGKNGLKGSETPVDVFGDVGDPGKPGTSYCPISSTRPHDLQLSSIVLISVSMVSQVPFTA